MKSKAQISALFLIMLILLSFAACSGNKDEQPTTSAPETSGARTQQEETEEATEEVEKSGEKTLVVYFSATGTTKGVAERIAKITGADVYEIKAEKEYTSADLDWHDSDSRTTSEQNDKSARPEIAGELPSLDGYSTVYLGYPIWWGEEPRIMDSFVEGCNFDGITVIPFCTSGSSGIGQSGRNLEDNAKSGTWLEGRRFGGSVSESELQAWIGSFE